jgi:hypothetical protein
MQNFGRGMWRRVGDYERTQVPIINKNYELEKYLGLMEYIKQQRKQMTQVNKDIITNNKPFDNKKMLIEEEVMLMKMLLMKMLLMKMLLMKMLLMKMLLMKRLLLMKMLLMKRLLMKTLLMKMLLMKRLLIL